MSNVNANSSDQKPHSDNSYLKSLIDRKNTTNVLFNFEETLLDLQRLTLEVGERSEARNNYGKKSKKPEKSGEDKQNTCESVPCTPICQPSISGLQQPNVRRWLRYQPYIRPKLKWYVLRKARPLDVSSLIKELGEIKLDADVEEIRRLTLLTASCAKLDLSSAGSCSFEATRYALADEGMAGEVAELAEYFSQFVNVGLKMSPLAESMYA